jgi:hypothetical protein
MKANNKGISLFLPLLIFIISCGKSGTKALDQGDYYNAVLQSVDKLRKDVDNEKSMAVLPEAYKYASQELLVDISSAKNANQQFRWERILDNYAKLNNMHDLIAKCMACRREVNPKSYFNEALNARELAAEERYIYASLALKKGTIEGGRDAFNSFEILFQFAPNFKDVSAKMDEALSAGSYHVVVEQPTLNVRAYELSHQYFQDRIDEFLRENKRMNKFIRFYSPSEAKAVNLKPDHVIRLEFVDFLVGQTFYEKKEKTLTSADSVKTGTAKIRGVSVDVYDKVKAAYFDNRKVVISKGLLSMKIIDFQVNKTLRQEEFPGEFTWVNEWASFNGDERALTKEELALTKKREEVPPSPQQLFIEFSKPIYDQFTRQIRRFYDNY